MTPKYVQKRDSSIRPFEISKIKKQIQFAIQGTDVNQTEIESLIKIPTKRQLLLRKYKNL